MSRIMRGNRRCRDVELRLICKELGVEHRFDELRALPGGPDAPEPSGGPPTQRPKRVLAGRPRLFAVLVGVLSIAMLSAAGVAVYSVRDRGGASQADGDAPPATKTVCVRRAVTGRDVWLRGEDGSPQEQIPGGAKVTVTATRNPYGLPYWKVRLDDGRIGWMDHKSLRSLCTALTRPAISPRPSTSFKPARLKPAEKRSVRVKRRIADGSMLCRTVRHYAW